PTCVPGAAWVTVAPLNGARYGNSGASDGTYYYSVSGSNLSSMLADVQRYDPVADTWTTRAPIPSAVQDAPVVYGNNGKLYVFGGLDSTTNVVYNLTQIYDIATNAWSNGAVMPAVRFGSYVGYFNGKIYVAGGFLANDVNTGQNTTFEYTIATNMWATKATMPNVNALGSYATIGQFLYTFGGWRGNPCCDGDAFRYDMSGNVWTTIASLPTALEGTAAAVSGGNIMVYGGGTPFAVGGVSTNQILSPDAVTTNQVYNPGTNTYSSGPALNQARVRFAGGNVGSYAMAVAGYTGSAVTAITERLQTACGTPTPTPTATP